MGMFRQIFCPAQVLIPVPLIQTMEQHDGVVRFFPTFREKYGIVETIVFDDSAIFQGVIGNLGGQLKIIGRLERKKTNVNARFFQGDIFAHSKEAKHLLLTLNEVEYVYFYGF